MLSKMVKKQPCHEYSLAFHGCGEQFHEIAMMENGWGEQRKINGKPATPILMTGGEGKLKQNLL
jgi:hypothetical protein